MRASLWRIELLGGLRAFPPNQAAVPLTRFSTAKTAALFAFLALHPHRVHTREELADRFWPDASPEAGRVSLRAALSGLRRELEHAADDGAIAYDGLLVADRQQIGVRADAFTTDVADFEVAVRRGDNGAARALYRGDLLPGVYDDWACRLRDDLAALADALPPYRSPSDCRWC